MSKYERIYKCLIIKHNVSFDDMLKSGIYMLKNTINNKCYIGQNFRPFIHRLHEHEICLINNRDSKYLQNAVNKYGIRNFEFSVIEFIPNELQEIINKRTKHCKDDRFKFIQWLDEHETYWINYYKTKFGNSYVYNLNSGGKGLDPLPEVIESRRQKLLKTNRNPIVKERRKISIINAVRKSSYKQHLSEAQKERFSNINEKIKISNLLKERWSNIHYKDRLKQKYKNRWNKEDEHIKHSNSIRQAYATNPEYKKKIGKKSSEMWSDKNHKEKHSNAIRQAYAINPEYKKKIGKKSSEMWSDDKKKESILIKKKHNRELYIKHSDNILYNVFLIRPELRKLGPIQRKRLINQIAEIIKQHNIV